MRKFLTAEWRHLVMLNYIVDPKILAPYVPAGTELDSWNGTTYISIVGFLFLQTRMLGRVAIPGHRDFEEVNLRFYVRRRSRDGWRRGVVFIKELVPRRAVAMTARLCYNEPYQALPMVHCPDFEHAEPGPGSTVEYAWRFGARWNTLGATVANTPRSLEAGSEAEIITEHYWGYGTRRSGATTEYRIEHDAWRVSEAREAWLDCDVAGVYGTAFVEALARRHRSAFVADGSAVAVAPGIRI